MQTIQNFVILLNNVEKHGLGGEKPCFYLVIQWFLKNTILMNKSSFLHFAVLGDPPVMI